MNPLARQILKRLAVILVYLSAPACCSLPSAAATDLPDVFSLAGDWRFELDRNNAGIRDRWYNRRLAQTINLPGSLPAQGIGNEVMLATKWIASVQDPQWYKKPIYAAYALPKNFRFPFWLQPDKYYAGAAWYQREIEVPEAWRGKRVVVTLERPHWETRVWIDGREIGVDDSLSTPHVYELGTALTAGRHRLTARVDNRLVVDIGINSHSITDHTQGNWNGVVGRIELSATDPIWISDVQVFPDVGAKSARVRVKLGNATQRAAKGVLAFRAEPVDATSPTTPLQVTHDVTVPIGGFETEVELPLGDNALLWDEFSPALYRLQATFGSEDSDTKLRDERHVTFGLREVSTAGPQFLVNGRKTFFRGTLECAIFPLTGYPPTDVESWKRIITVCKKHGLNMIRFHSWCPPEAAFIAADELGFYYQVEAASWANQSTTLGDGKPVDQWVQRETDRILQAYGNHPSFLLMTYGNEPGGKNYDSYLGDWVRRCRQTDPRRLYSSASGWPQIAENQFHVTPDPRIQAWGDGLKSRINARPPETRTDYRDYIRQRNVPVIAHEIGQWCVYPNFAEVEKYTGYLEPKNFAIFRDSLNANSMAAQAHDFLMASGKLQVLCYKEDIEAALRTPGMGGFQLLDLHDFPGQGTALVGVLDPFWDSKGYVTAEEYRRFCNETVPLARFDKRVFTTEEKLKADLEVAHFGAAPLKNAVAKWSLVDDHGDVVASGELPARTIPVDNGIKLGRAEIELRDIKAPAKYKFVVGIANTSFENDWDVWVYPPRVNVEPADGIHIVNDLDDAALRALDAGGKVLLTIPPYRVRGDQFGPIGLGLSSIFWNTAWTGRQPPHTLGIFCDPRHPLFAQFPTEFHSNWQWWYLVSRGGAMILDGLPPGLRPTVQVIDDWTTNRRLGLLVEAKLGSGKLAVCSVDIDSDLDTDPVRRQFRHALLTYLNSNQFDPRERVSAEQVQSLMIPASPMHQLGIVSVTTDSEEFDTDGYRAIDGDPKTIWHTPWRDKPPPFPHSLEVRFKTPISMRGFTVLPRQDGVRNGWINEYVLFTSVDGQDWGQPVARGSFTADKALKTVALPKPILARFVRLVATSGFDSKPYASVAEFAVLTADKPVDDHGRSALSTN